MFLISPLHHLHFVKYLMSLKVYHYGNKIPALPTPNAYGWCRIPYLAYQNRSGFNYWYKKKIRPYVNIIQSIEASHTTLKYI